MSKGTKTNPSFYLQMIAYFFAGQFLVSVGILWTSWNVMRKPRGKKLTKTKQPSCLVNPPQSTKHKIKTALGLQEIEQYEHYLGLPSLVRRRKKYSFNLIKEKVWRKLQSWEGNLLSQASREVLIKAIIHAISTFAMGCFKIPLGLYHDIKALIKKIWWDQRGEGGRSIG